MPKAKKIPVQSEGSTITVTVPASGSGNSPANQAEPEKKDFWEQCSEVPSSGWGSDYMIYVYRDDPPGRYSGYIAKLTEPIDRDDFAQKFGGYSYRLMLNKNGKMIAATQHKVAMPPKAVGAMDPAMIANPSAPALLPQGDMTQMFSQFVDLMKDKMGSAADKNTVELMMQASKSAMEIMRTQTPNPFEMFRTMMELQRQNGAPESSMLTAMMGMFTTMMSKLMERSLTPDGGLTAQLRTFMEFQQLLGTGGGDGGGKSKGPDLGAVLVAKLPELLQQGGVLLQKYVQISDNNRRAAEAARGVPPTITVPAAPGPIPVSQPAAAPAPQPAAAPTTGTHFAPLERDKFDPAAVLAADSTPENFDRMKVKVVQAILMGASADSVLDYIAIDNPMLMTALRDATVETLKEFFANDPILRQALNYHGFEEFLKDGVEYIREQVEAEQGGGAVQEPAFKN